MPRNRKLAILALAAIVGLAAFLVHMMLTPASDPLSLTLQSYTNASAVITIKNQSSLHLDYAVMVERKFGDKWPEGLAPGTTIPQHQLGSLDAGQHTNLNIEVMVHAPPCPWRISVFCIGPPTQQTSVRAKAALWLWNHDFPKIAHTLFRPGSKQIQVSTPEMEQREK
jgi:hypothetical protein